ncbi:MAG TPA: hypothetical protein VLZ72_04565 [Flavobacterium sp.]|nr:hypothetical protein [Flavobacterium sp.]
MIRLKNIALLSVLLLMLSCGTAIKTIAGFKNPKVETKENVSQFLSDVNSDEKTYFLGINKPGDSISIYKNFLFGFNSDMYLYSKSGEKYCYKGTEECSGVQLQSAFKEFEENYLPCTDDDSENLLTFLEQIVDSKGNPVEISSLPPADYYIFETWNKYSGSQKKLKEDLDWLLGLKNNSNHHIEIILINTDLLEEWGLEKNGELPIKFKKEGKSMRLTFGKMPFKNSTS